MLALCIVLPSLSTTTGESTQGQITLRKIGPLHISLRMAAGSAVHAGEEHVGCHLITHIALK